MKIYSMPFSTWHCNMFGEEMLVTDMGGVCLKEGIGILLSLHTHVTSPRPGRMPDSPQGPTSSGDRPAPDTEQHRHGCHVVIPLPAPRCRPVTPPARPTPPVPRGTPRLPLGRCLFSSRWCPPRNSRPRTGCPVVCGLRGPRRSPHRKGCTAPSHRGQRGRHAAT